VISFVRLGGTLSRIAGARFDGKAKGVYRGARPERPSKNFGGRESYA
jgi:hypothetical protein